MFGMFLSFIAGHMIYFWLHLESSSFPRPLSPKEERECLAALQQGDREARDRLIRHNLRLVAHIVKKYYPGSADTDDLISIGTIGLIKAVASYNGEKKTRFSTYAARCIENAILTKAVVFQKEYGEIEGERRYQSRSKFCKNSGDHPTFDI